MKHITHIIIGIVLFFVSGLFCPSAFSQSYRDSFDVLREKNWEHWGKYTIWKVENGFLKGWIHSPPDLIGAVQDAKPTIELLQFKDFSGSYENFEISVGRDLIKRQIKNPGYENFTITVKNLGGKQTDFGIAIGHRFSDLPHARPFFYLFLTHRMYAVSFNAWGGVSFTPKRLQKHNLDIRWKTWELASMEIRFNSGHFQWFADGEKRADFEDPDFSSVEILGFVVIGDGLRAGHVWVDSFKISGPGLSVSPQTKLATTWGQLKQRQ